jgi:geranylgeranyl pyrophosphate synthase
VSVSVDLEAWIGARAPALDAALRAAFAGCWPERFVEALQYPVFGGGKRVRPLLVLAAHEAVAGAGADTTPALAAAVAVELVHTYSLVHDDLPCMDDDDVRRGRPTVHRAFDEGAAVLVGDGLLTLAFQVLAEAAHPAEARVVMVAELARAAGPAGMVAGQAADVGMGGPVTTVEQLARLHAGKTGALLCASAVLGGLSAGADADGLAALRRYGRAVGMAFQLADDVLDADQDAGDGGPPSYVKLLGVDETSRRARAYADEATAAIAGLPSPGALRALAEFTVARRV